MDSFVITWRELLLVVAVVLAIYVAEMLLLLRANRAGGPRVLRRRGPQDSILGQRLERLEDELADVRAQMAKLEAVVGSLERPTPVVQSPQTPQTPYSQAIQLAKEGLDPSDVAASCGISRGEAELIVAMHRARQP